MPEGRAHRSLELLDRLLESLELGAHRDDAVLKSGHWAVYDVSKPGLGGDDSNRLDLR